MAETHELKLLVTVDKNTKELTVLNAELNNVQMSEEELEKTLKKLNQEQDKMTKGAVGWKQAMTVLVGAFSVGVLANFFKSAALEAAKYDKESNTALKNSDRMWRNLKESIGQGFLPIIKQIPTLIQNIALGFGRLRQGMEILMGGIASLISKNIKYSDEVKQANERYQQFVKDVVQGEMHLSTETEKARKELLDKIKQLTQSKYDYEKTKLDEEVQAYREAGLSEELIARYKANKLKEITSRQAADERQIKEQNDLAYAQLQEFLADEGIQKEMAVIDKRVQQQLQKNNQLISADKKYVDQSKQILAKGEADKQKAVYESISKKLDLNKLASATVDLLATTDSEKQQEMAWQMVREEASGYAKRMLVAAAYYVAIGNYAQAALAAAQVAVAIGVARFADGEAEKLRIQRENDAARLNAQIELEEQKKEAAEEAATTAEEIENNRMEYEYNNGKISADTYINFLKQRQRAYKQYTDDWMSIQSQIDSIEQDRIAALKEEAEASSAISGDIKGSSVTSEQKTINNYVTINVNVQALDTTSMSESWLRDFATKLWGYLNQQLTGRG